MANNNVEKGATLIDFNNNKLVDEQVIHMNYDALEKLKNIISLSQHYLLNYFAKVGEEIIQDQMKKPLEEHTEEEQNDLLMVGLGMHAIEIFSLYTPDSPVTTTMIAEYFDDLTVHLDTYVTKPFQSFKDLEALNLESYVEDIPSTEEESTLDTFWLTRARDFVNENKALEASKSMAIDYSQMMYDCLAECLNDSVEVYWQENEKKFDPVSKEFVEGFNDHIKTNFGSLFATAINLANSDFLKYLFDPSSKILMRLIKYVEEDTYDFFSNATGSNPSFAQRYESFEKSSRVSKTSAFEYFQDDFVTFFMKGRSMELFTSKDFKALNTESLMLDAENAAFDFLSNYVGEEGLAEDNVLETHTRVAICVQIYKLFFRYACQELEATVNRMTEEFVVEDFETPERFREIRTANIMTNEATIMMDSITHASNMLWIDLYPKQSFLIQIDDDETESAKDQPELEEVS